MVTVLDPTAHVTVDGKAEIAIKVQLKKVPLFCE